MDVPDCAKIGSDGIESNCTVTIHHRLREDPTMWMCQGSGSVAFALPHGVGLQGFRDYGAVRSCSVEW